MKTLKTMMVAFAILLPTAIGHAQDSKSLPSEIDLRAAYCMPITKHFIKLVQVPPSQYPEPPRVKAAREAVLQQSLEELRRLQLYLLPRIRHLESLGIATAMKRGQEDIANIEAYGKMCSAKCQHLESARNSSPRNLCVDQCNATNPLNSRLKACSDLSWLPY
jgi:hypothetical protein